MAKLTCTKCGKHHKNDNDPDFCNECYDSIDNLMLRTRAAVRLLNGNHGLGDGQTQKAKMFAFLSLFHPSMTYAQKRSICSNMQNG